MEKKGTLASPATALARSVYPCPGADEQHALGDPAAKLGELLRMTEELDDLHKFFLCLVHAGHVVEGHLDVALAVDLGARLAEAHERLATRAARAHPPKDEAPDKHKHNEGKYPGEQKVLEPVVRNLAAVGNTACFKGFNEVGVFDAHDREGFSLLSARLLGHARSLDGVARDGEVLHFLFRQEGLERAVGNFLGLRL